MRTKLQTEQIIEFSRDALDSIWAHKLRSILTMLGIVIGIASIIAISSTILGTNEQIKNNLIGAGNNVVSVRLYKGDYEIELDYESIPEGVPALDKNIIDDVKKISGVNGASCYYYRNAYNAVSHGADMLSMGTVLGVDENYIDVYGYVLRAGRDFNEEDFKEFRKVAIIDKTVSELLFHGSSPIGQTIEIKGEPYIVIGEIVEASETSPTITTLDDYLTYMNTSGGSVLIPMQTWPVVYKYDEPISVAVQATSTDKMTTIGNEVVELLNGRFTKETGDVKYKSDDILKKAKDLQELSTSTNRQLIWIASISLLVGGIGVMNIMLVSMTERTKEIGLKKALGARRKNISLQFLVEAGMLTCIGGIIGVIAGIILAVIISKISSVPIAINFYIIIATVIFSFIVGLFFGAFPAVQASKLNPIDALRRE